MSSENAFSREFANQYFVEFTEKSTTIVVDSDGAVSEEEDTENVPGPSKRKPEAKAKVEKGKAKAKEEKGKAKAKERAEENGVAVAAKTRVGGEEESAALSHHREAQLRIFEDQLFKLRFEREVLDAQIAFLEEHKKKWEKHLQ